MSTFDKVGLWFLFGASVWTFLLVALTFHKSKATALNKTVVLVASVLYALFYLHLLGVLK